MPFAKTTSCLGVGGHVDVRGEEDYSQVAGFDAGADDYITKPIKPKVLSAAKALLRRHVETASRKAKRAFWNLEHCPCDLQKYQVRVRERNSICPERESTL